MRNDSVKTFSLKASKGLLIFTLFLGVAPFMLYGWAIYTGSLPNEQEWSARGGNHGPWWGTAQEPTILLSLLLLSGLSFWSFVVGAWLSLRSKKLAPFVWGLALAALQFAFAYGQLVTIFWTVD